VNVNNRNSLGLTALHQAASRGCLPFLQALLAAGANVNSQTENGETENGETENGETPLHYACKYNHTNIVPTLLAAGANVNLQTESGMTALHYACEDSPNAVPILLAAGANVHSQARSFNQTALHIACQKNDAITLRSLLSAGANVNLVDSFGCTALHTVCRRNYRAHLIPILAAAEADVNSEEKYRGFTPLHFACLLGNVDSVNAMLDAGASVNARDKLGQTPLHTAVQNHHPAIVGTLLEAKADKNLKYGCGFTAVMLESIEHDIYHLLMQHSDINISLRDHAGETAIDIAVRRGKFEVVEIIRKAHGMRTD
jgi:ankyrin repeat protein